MHSRRHSIVLAIHAEYRSDRLCWQHYALPGRTILAGVHASRNYTLGNRFRKHKVLVEVVDVELHGQQCLPMMVPLLTIATRFDHLTDRMKLVERDHPLLDHGMTTKTRICKALPLNHAIVIHAIFRCRTITAGSTKAIGCKTGKPPNCDRTCVWRSLACAKAVCPTVCGKASAPDTESSHTGKSLLRCDSADQQALWPIS